MTFRLDYWHQPELLEMILRKMSEEETGRLIILTSDGRENVSSKVLQLHSPLVRDLMANMVTGGPAQVVSIPDVSSDTVGNLYKLLMRGELMGIKDENIILELEEVDIPLYHLNDKVVESLVVNNPNMHHLNIYRSSSLTFQSTNLLAKNCYTSFYSY